MTHVRRGRQKGRVTHCLRYVSGIAPLRLSTVFRLARSRHMLEHYVAHNLPLNGLLKNGERFGFGCTWDEAFRYLSKVVKVLEVERALLKSKLNA